MVQEGEDRRETHHTGSNEVEDPESEVSNDLDGPDVEHGVELGPVDVCAERSSSRSTTHLTSS